MGSFKVPTTVDKRVILCADGSTLGPYFRNRSCASESLSPTQDFDCCPIVDARVTSTSYSYHRALCLRDHTVGECPWNVGCSSTHFAATANTNDDGVCTESVGKIWNGLGRRSKYNTDLPRMPSQVLVGSCLERCPSRLCRTYLLASTWPRNLCCCPCLLSTQVTRFLWPEVVLE